MILYPSLVQGADAAEMLASGIVFFQMTEMVDVIILGRGGGSAEDLWAFNDEFLARTVAACSIPVISAVGHESDFTICDFVADLRAPTPSAAAELALPDRAALLEGLSETRTRMQALLTRRIATERRALEALAQSRVLRMPQRMLEPFQMRLSLLQERMDRTETDGIAQRRERLMRGVDRLEALSPLAVLRRGYAMVSNGDQIVKSVKSVQEGDRLRIRFSDGAATAVVTHRTETEE